MARFLSRDWLAIAAALLAPLAAAAVLLPFRASWSNTNVALVLVVVVVVVAAIGNRIAGRARTRHRPDHPRRRLAQSGTVWLRAGSGSPCLAR